MRTILAILVLLLCSQSVDAIGPFRRAAHNGLVAQSGIRPARVGSYEGVGMSTRSADAAIRAACYWGQRTPVSIQTSFRKGRYYAVVRYK